MIGWTLKFEVLICVGFFVVVVVVNAGLWTNFLH